MSIDGTIRLPNAPAPTGGVTGGLYDVLAAAGPVEPGTGPVLLDKVRDLGAALEQLPAALTQLGNDDLTDLMGVLLRLQARAGQVAALAAADATERGAVMASDAGGTQQWVTGCAADAGVSVEARDAKTLSVIAQGCREARNRVVTAAVRDGACTLATARKVLEHTGRVARILPTLAREDIQAWFLQLDPAWGSRGVDELTRALRAKYEADVLDAEDAQLEEVETLSWRRLPTGMWRLTADLAPGTAALLKQAITAMSAPMPAKKNSGTSTGADDSNDSDATAETTQADAGDAGARNRGDKPYGGSFGPLNLDDEGDDTGRHGRDSVDDWHGDNNDLAGDNDDAVTGEKIRDERSPGKRRVDALVDLVGAGAKVANGDGTGVGAAATLVVTMDLDALLAGVGEATTITGDTLDASTARRLACDANLIPIVLGKDSEPLDVGRRERLVTKGMRAAVVFRDRGCTFPGCDRPPGFCDVHHPTPWFAGGKTCLTNAVLLCHRHHQVVHRKGYFATITAEGVSWNLTIGAMPRLDLHRLQSSVLSAATRRHTPTSMSMVRFIRY